MHASMNIVGRFWAWIGGRPAAGAPVPAGFLGRPATAYRIAAQRAVIGYIDGNGTPSFRPVTFDEVLDQNGHRYLAGYCHERFARRHFRLDRITFLHRFDTGEHVDPAREVARWLERA